MLILVTAALALEPRVDVGAGVLASTNPYRLTNDEQPGLGTWTTAKYDAYPDSGPLDYVWAWTEAAWWVLKPNDAWLPVFQDSYMSVASSSPLDATHGFRLGLDAKQGVGDHVDRVWNSLVSDATADLTGSYLYRPGTTTYTLSAVAQGRRIGQGTTTLNTRGQAGPQLAVMLDRGAWGFTLDAALAWFAWTRDSQRYDSVWWTVDIPIEDGRRAEVGGGAYTYSAKAILFANAGLTRLSYPTATHQRVTGSVLLMGTPSGGGMPELSFGRSLQDDWMTQAVAVDWLLIGWSKQKTFGFDTSAAMERWERLGPLARQELVVSAELELSVGNERLRGAVKGDWRRRVSKGDNIDPGLEYDESRVLIQLTMTPPS